MEEEKRLASQNSGFNGVLNYFGLGNPKTQFKKHSFAWYLDKVKLPENEVIECPICLLELDKLDIVVGLACSDKHVYHKECF